jgi:hypothetical protein
MSSHVLEHVLYQIANVPIRTHPYPHFYVRDVFPDDFYREMRSHLPPFETFKSLKALGRVRADYPDSRMVFPVTPDNVKALGEPFASFWTWVANQFLTGEFMQKMLAHFSVFLDQRCAGATDLHFHDEALIVRDSSTYQLGPHTDTVKKALSFLFYLPPDDSMARLGTSIYAPKQADFLCMRGKEYPFDQFHLVKTMPYLPNSLFAFVKTSNSFHGVEPITEAGVCRDLLLYDVQMKVPPEMQSADRPDGTKAKFSF